MWYVAIVTQSHRPVFWLYVELGNFENWPINKDFTTIFVNKQNEHVYSCIFFIIIKSLRDKGVEMQTANHEDWLPYIADHNITKSAHKILNYNQIKKKHYKV